MERDTFTVGLPERVDFTHAPIPTNDSERLLFRQMYHPLVRLDCNAIPEPGLASAWSFDSSSSQWTFTLSPSGLGSAGTPLSSEQILTTWRSRPSQLQRLGITQVIASGDRLTVGVRNLQGDDPGIFAQPSLAIGTPGAVTSASGDHVFQMLGAKPSVVEYRTLTSGDLRDALDAGVDLLVTRDPAVLEYAAAQPSFTTYPLPWSRVYILVQPAGAEPFPSLQTDSVRASLARDAVHAEAQLYSPEEQWSPAACAGPASTPSLRISPRVVYPEKDGVARAVAERVVALSGNDPRLSAAGLTDSAFAVVLARGTERGYVLPFSRSAASCADLPPLPGASTVLPLIETRARAVVRRGSPELAVEWDGTVRILAGPDQGVNP